MVVFLEPWIGPAMLDLAVSSGPATGEVWVTPSTEDISPQVLFTVIEYP
jgi:hypothetical protein